MKRRRFLGTAGLAGILAAGAAPAVHANQPVRWRLASSSTKSLDITLEGAYSFARRAKEMSGGKIDISVFPADELMPSFGVFDGVQKGQVECGHTVPVYYFEKDAAFALDGSIPFGLDARQMTAWMQEGNGLALLQELYRAHGIVNFPMGNTGVQMGGWYHKPVKSVASLKGLRMRIAGLGGQVLQRLGVKPVVLPPGEIYKALEQNRLDAAEWIGPYDDLKLGLHKIAKYYGYPGWWESGTQSALYINQRAYGSLTNENKAIIEAAAAATHLEIQSRYDARNPAALKELIAQGAQLMPFPKTVLEAAYKTAQELYADLAAKSPNWKKIHGSYARFQRDIAWSWGFSEIALGGFMHDKSVELQKKQQQKSAPAGRHGK